MGRAFSIHGGDETWWHSSNCCVRRHETLVQSDSLSPSASHLSNCVWCLVCSSYTILGILFQSVLIFSSYFEKLLKTVESDFPRSWFMYMCSCLYSSGQFWESWSLEQWILTELDNIKSYATFGENLTELISWPPWPHPHFRHDILPVGWLLNDQNLNCMMN